jgi:galacturan 1,4-alpha-galacturonidase
VLAFVNDALINAIHLVDSKFFHMTVFASNNVVINKLKIKAPGDSPNTDGIHIGDVTNINITDTIIGTGDDCVSIGPGSVNVTVSNVTCGPGHGISIGSLGKYMNEKDVRGLRVENCALMGTTNGLRIKTWEDTPSPLVASDIVFDNIQMDNVENPIIVDQKYCPHNFCSDADVSSTN